MSSMRRRYTDEPKASWATLFAETDTRNATFLATKVWTEGKDRGIAEMEESLRRFRTDRIDLMQIHNLVDWQTQLETLRLWKEAGIFRYIGITHDTSGAIDREHGVGA